MERGVVTVSPDLTLRELVETLLDEGVSGVPVVEDGEVVGVISATDAVMFAESASERIESGSREPAPEDEVAVEELVEVGESADTADFPGTQEPAMDGLRRIRTADAPEWNLFNEFTVAELMTRNVISLSLTRSVREAARVMVAEGVHRVLVEENAELVGILTASDIVRAVAEGRLKPRPSADGDTR